MGKAQFRLYTLREAEGSQPQKAPKEPRERQRTDSRIGS